MLSLNNAFQLINSNTDNQLLNTDSKGNMAASSVVVNRDKPFPLLKLPKELILSITSMIDKQSVVKLTLTSKLLKPLLPDMFYSNGSIEKLITEVFERGVQGQFFKMFSGKYNNIHTVCLKSEGRDYCHIDCQDILQVVDRFPNILEIILQNVRMKADDFQLLISKYPEVKKLVFKRTSNSEACDPEIFPAIANLKRLELVDFSGTRIVDEDLQNILRANPNIKEVSLQKCYNITPDGFKSLTDVHALVLRDTSINDKALQGILKANPNIKKIDLSYCEGITSDGFKALAEVHLLEEVIFKGAQINDEALQNILKANPNIKKIDLSYCESITLGGLKALANGRLLETIVIGGSSMNDEVFKAICVANPNIKEIDLSYYDEITPDGFKALAEIHSLEKVTFKATSIEDEVFQNILEANRNIKEIDLSECMEITASGLQALVTLKWLAKVNLASVNLTQEQLENIRKANPGVNIRTH